MELRTIEHPIKNTAMKKSLTLSIAKPCGEDWNSFTPTDTGGFCASCNKNVIDFTHAGETEILNFFKNKPAHVCGRFRSDQLKTYLPAPNVVQPGFMLLRAGLLGLLFLLISKPGTAQVPVAKANVEILQRSQNNTVEAGRQKEVRVSGVVTSSEDGSPLPFVNIYIKDTVIGTITDIEGKFDIHVKPGSTLVISYLGYITINLPVTETPRKSA
jgi:CarboxypepD_reg-like domain